MITRVMRLLMEVGIEPDRATEEEFMLAEKACHRYFLLHNRVVYFKKVLNGPHGEGSSDC